MPHARKQPSRLNYVALADFRYEIRRFLHFAQQAAHEVGIEPQQYQALLALRGFPDGHPPTVGSLAERMLLRHHSAVELSARLERAGWIHRRRGTLDRREVLVHLTLRGERLLERLSRLHRDELRTTAPRLIEALQSVVANAHATPKQKRRPHSKQK